MQHKVAGGTLVAIGAVLVVFALFWGTGAPSAPTAQLSGTINPSQAQTFQLTFATQAGSTIAPNGINQLPPFFIYSINESNANGGMTVVAQSQRVSAQVQGSSWPTWTLTGTVSVTTVALCTASCGGVTSNITVTVQALTQGGGFASPTSTITFSSQSAYTTKQTTPTPNLSSFLPQFPGVFLVGVGLLALGLGVAVPVGSTTLKWIGGILTIVGFVIVLFA